MSRRAYFFLRSERPIPDLAFLKWINIALTAVLVFGYAARKYWKFRARWALWAELFVLLVAHFAVLSRLPWGDGGYAWLIVVVGLPEMILVFVILDLLYKPDPEISAESHPTAESNS